MTPRRQLVRETTPRKQVDLSLRDLLATSSTGKFQAGDTTILFGVWGEGKPYVEISSVRTPAHKRGRGSARAALTAFLHRVDQELGLPVVLGASPLDKRTRLDRLVAFYQSLGFELTGVKINGLGHPELVRPPPGKYEPVPRKERSVVERARVKPTEPNPADMARDLAVLQAAGWSATPGLKDSVGIYWPGVVRRLMEGNLSPVEETARLWRLLTPADHRKIKKEREAQAEAKHQVTATLDQLLPGAERAGFWRWAYAEATDEEDRQRVDAAKAGEDLDAREDLLQDYLRAEHSIEVRADGLVSFDQLSRDVRSIIGSQPVVLFHHTSDKVRAKVKREGLHTRGKAANPYRNSRAGVYLTTETSGAVVDGYQRRATSAHGGNPHTFEVRTTIPELDLDPDDRDIPRLHGRQFVLPEVPPDQIIGLAPARKSGKVERLPVSPQSHAQASADLPALERYGLGPRAKTIVERAIFATQPGVKPAIQQALARLPGRLRNVLGHWQYVFQGGRQPLDDLLEDHAQVFADAFRPVLQLLPARVRLYRGEPVNADRSAPRTFLSWTDQRRDAEGFAGVGGLLRVADVPRDQILAVLEHGNALEFLVKAQQEDGRGLPGERAVQASASLWYIEIRVFDRKPGAWRAVPGTAELRRAEAALRKLGVPFHWKPQRFDNEDYWSGAEPAADHGTLWFRATPAIADRLHAQGFSVRAWNFNYVFPARSEGGK
jgi:hypothetical protein